MTKWEYCVLEVQASAEGALMLDNLGKKGWELVAVSVHFTSHYAWLKRPLPAPPSSGVST